MPKVIISGYYGFKNFGDELILKILTEHLKSVNADITVLSSDIEYTRNACQVNAIARFDIKNIINEIKHSDVVISGGGSLLQDATSLKSLIYYAFIIALGILFNKKTIIFAQGIGPLNSKSAQTIVKNLLKYCSYISVRDEKSHELLKNLEINSDLVCDPVYSLNILPKFEKGIVGIQLRDFKTVNYNLLQKLAMLITTKFSDKKIEIYSLQKSIDYEICKKFENILKNLSPDTQTEIIEENVLTRISQLEYMIGMRFHAILAAIKSGVKTCAVNYDIKVEKLAQEAQIPVISIDAHENMEKIYNNLQNIDVEKLLQFANSKRFDWTAFDKNLITY